VTTKDVWRLDVIPVGTARRVAGSRVLCASVSSPMEEEPVGGASAVGERKNSMDQVFGVVPGAFLDPF
jgi:hypothetical protein